MKTVVTNAEVPHLWAHQSQSSARNSSRSFYFDGPTVYSYRDSFPIATHVENKRGDKAILLTTRGYSATTGKHINLVRRAIPEGVQVFNVAFRRNDSSGYESSTRFGADIDAAALVADYNTKIIEHERKAARVRLPYARESQLHAAAQTRDEALAFVRFYSLKGKAAKIVPLHTNLAEIKVAAAKDAARQAAELQAEYATQIDRWQAGESVNLPYNLDTLLRVKDGEVETSRGARFPIRDARRGLALVDATVASARPWQANGHTCRLGVYHIDRIDANGAVHAGCHVVPLKSIERVRSEIMAAPEPEVSA